MSTWFLPCGCHGTRSMFGEHQILSLNLCINHSNIKNIQDYFEDSLRIIKTNPVETIKYE